MYLKILTFICVDMNDKYISTMKYIFYSTYLTIGGTHVGGFFPIIPDVLLSQKLNLNSEEKTLSSHYFSNIFVQKLLLFVDCGCIFI